MHVCTMCIQATDNRLVPFLFFLQQNLLEIISLARLAGQRALEMNQSLPPHPLAPTARDWPLALMLGIEYIAH